MDMLDRNRLLLDKAARVIPSGLTANYLVSEGMPVYFVAGNGSRLKDVAGREYLDYSLSAGAAILGHSNSALREGLRRQADRLCTNANNPLEAEAAELICRNIPSAERVYFASSGSEAVGHAFRVARAHTRRNMIVRFRGSYHGISDALLGGIPFGPCEPEREGQTAQFYEFPEEAK